MVVAESCMAAEGLGSKLHLMSIGNNLEGVGRRLGGVLCAAEEEGVRLGGGASSSLGVARSDNDSWG